jgi:anaerobic ribonucleoside-triphosphate reductase activating protein
MLTIRLAKSLDVDSVVDGDGLRTVLWTQGCLLRCPGCHNPGTHDVAGGFEEPVELVKMRLRNRRHGHQQGITFSGGEPFLQAEACAEIACFVRKSLGWDVWSFSGYRFEQLRERAECLPLLRELDVLVDGPFVLALRDPMLRFRGSSNQRILRLKDGELVEEKKI